MSAPFEREGIFFIDSFLIFFGIVDSACLIIFSVSGKTSSFFKIKGFSFFDFILLGWDIFFSSLGISDLSSSIIARTVPFETLSPILTCNDEIFPEKGLNCGINKYQIWQQK